MEFIEECIQCHQELTEKNVFFMDDDNYCYCSKKCIAEARVDQIRQWEYQEY